MKIRRWYFIGGIALMFSCGNPHAKQKQNLHGDHTVFGVNKLKPHADFFAFETESLALRNNPDSSERFLSLNGNWKFLWVSSPKERIRNFFDVDLDDSNWGTIQVPSNWEVAGYGHPVYLDERYHFTPIQDSLPDIPRLGIYMILPNHFTETEWYGRGPHETYRDRKFSGKTGIYKGHIQDQFHRYPRPQETGNKTDIRWMRIQSNTLNLTVHPTDNQLLSGSVWPFNTSELDFVARKDAGISASGLVPVTTRHGADIDTGNQVQWNIDHLQMGVGGDNSWGRLVHDEYTIPVKAYHYSFIIIPERRQ